MKKTKKDIEKSLRKKYLKRITNVVKNRYRKIAESEIKDKDFYLEKGDTYNKKNKLVSDILKSYEPLILQEIEYRYSEIVNSESYKTALEREQSVLNNRLHHKNLKEYKEFPIHVQDEFQQALLLDINNNLTASDRPFTLDEIKYLTLITLYGIIHYIKNNFIVKVGTCLTFFTKQRDIRINLPDDKIDCDRILEDRIIPKVKLCKTFGHEYFLKINEGNKAIFDYYREKVERFLILIKVKKTKNEN